MQMQKDRQVPGSGQVVNQMEIGHLCQRMQGQP